MLICMRGKQLVSNENTFTIHSLITKFSGKNLHHIPLVLVARIVIFAHLHLGELPLTIVMALAHQEIHFMS